MSSKITFRFEERIHNPCFRYNLHKIYTPFRFHEYTKSHTSHMHYINHINYINKPLFYPIKIQEDTHKKNKEQKKKIDFIPFFIDI